MTANAREWAGTPPASAEVEIAGYQAVTPARAPGRCRSTSTSS